MFHKTRTPLLQWFWTIFLVAKDKRGHSALQLSKELNISYDRAWLMLHKIRNAMSSRDMLYQLDGIVEMDEAISGLPIQAEEDEVRGVLRPLWRWAYR